MITNRFPEIVKRSESGPYLREADFEKLLMQKVRELVRRYDICFNPGVVVPWDDSLTDTVYHAKLDLFVELGAYNISTQRSIHFTREEIETAIAHAPVAVILGSGEDAVTMRTRGVESS